MKIDAWRRGCATSTRLSKANIGAAAYALDADGAQHQVERVICKNDIESKPASNVLTGETNGNRTSLTFRERCVGITLPTFDLQYIVGNFQNLFLIIIQFWSWNELLYILFVARNEMPYHLLRSIIFTK